MTKRTRKTAKNQNADSSSHVKAARPVLSPSEQLREAFTELKESTVFFLETALNEAQQNAVAIVQELKARTTTLLASFAQSTKLGRQAVTSLGGRKHAHAGNAALS